jgi:serine/threonine-protein kinase
MSATPTFSPGETFERYTIEARLGSGGMGDVYRAHDERLHRHVALKVVSAARIAEGGREARARLMREARAAAGLDHPNAVAIYDVGEAPARAGEEPRPYIVMELVAGETLRAHVGGSAVPWQQRLGWMLDVARALAAAHDRGLVHRDIKPENVMVRRDGLVKVLDFGIARRTNAPVDGSAPTAQHGLPTITEQGIQVGTPLYMAPEQIRGDAVDGRTDQFAWAVCAYELVAGRIPWKVEAGSLGAVASILTDAPPDLGALVPELPGGVVAAIERALSKKADARFATMRDLIEEIEAHLDEALRPGSGPRAARATRAPSAKPSPPSGAEDLRRYSTDEMRDILQRAVEREAQRGTGFTRQELVEAAKEAGVDEKAIDAALIEAETVRNAPNELAERRKRARLAFIRHLVSYLVVNCGLALMTGRFLKPLLAFWGIGLLLHLVNVIIPTGDEKKKRGRKEGERERKRSQREERELEAAVETLVHVTTARHARRRIAVPPPERAVAAGDTERAELEAAAAAEAEASRRRKEKVRP